MKKKKKGNYLNICKNNFIFFWFFFLCFPVLNSPNALIVLSPVTDTPDNSIILPFFLLLGNI